MNTSIRPIPGLHESQCKYIYISKTLINEVCKTLTWFLRHLESNATVRSWFEKKMAGNTTIKPLKATHPINYKWIRQLILQVLNGCHWPMDKSLTVPEQQPVYISSSQLSQQTIIINLLHLWFHNQFVSTWLFYTTIFNMVCIEEKVEMTSSRWESSLCPRFQLKWDLDDQGAGNKMLSEGTRTPNLRRHCCDLSHPRILNSSRNSTMQKSR